MKTWEADLRRVRDKSAHDEIADLKHDLADSDSGTLKALEQRVKELPVDSFGQEVRHELAAFAASLFDRQNQIEIADLNDQLEKAKSQAAGPQLKSSELWLLRVQVQQVQSRLLEAKLNGASVEKVAARCEELLLNLDQRLQVMSVRQMQEIADADAIKELQTAKGIFTKMLNESTGNTWQWCGEQTAEAEQHVLRIDRLCSAEMQLQARHLLQKYRKDALESKAGQQRAYNRWAIGVLEDSMKQYKDAKGIFKDDKDRLKQILAEKVGEIDPANLHPVTLALFTEMYQKILSDLKDDQKVEVTRAVQEKMKKPLSDF